MLTNYIFLYFFHCSELRLSIPSYFSLLYIVYRQTDYGTTDYKQHAQSKAKNYFLVINSCYFRFFEQYMYYRGRWYDE